MTTLEAIKTWKGLKDSTTRASLDDAGRHAVIHEIMNAVSGAIARHEMTYEQFENEVSR